MNTIQPTPTTIQPNQIYTVDQAATLLSMHPVTIRDKLRVGIIRGSRRIGRWRIIGSELLRLAAA